METKIEREFPSIHSANRIARFLANAYHRTCLSFRGVDIGGHKNFRVGMFTPNGKLIRYIPAVAVRYIAFNKEMRRLISTEAEAVSIWGDQAVE